MTSIETISIVIAAVSVVIGVINSIRSNQKAEEQRQTEIETRQAQLFMDLYETYRNKDFRKQFYQFMYHMNWTDYDNFKKDLESETGLESVSDLGALMGYFEGIGFLVKQNLISEDYVLDVFAPTLSLVWEKYEPYALEERKAWNLPLHKNFEYLYNVMKQRQQANLSP